MTAGWSEGYYACQVTVPIQSGDDRPARLRGAAAGPGPAGYRDAGAGWPGSGPTPGQLRATAGGGVLHRLRRACAVGLRGGGH
ncbi:hypothetical protein G6F63_015255 [Rhizopus arrhizus]|nr:hypothetical protein G6F63_015255 [Rhizopus arrhizus]